MVYKTLTEGQIDALQEIANIGTGNAASLLSKKINKTINIDIPITKLVALENFVHEIRDPKEISVGIYHKTFGDIDGQVLFLIEKKQALELVNIIGTKKSSNIGKKETKALEEISSAFSSAYLKALSNMLSINVDVNEPDVTIDMTSAICDPILAQLGTKHDCVLLIKSMIKLQNHDVEGIFLFFLDPQSKDYILNLINEKFGAIE